MPVAKKKSKKAVKKVSEAKLYALAEKSLADFSAASEERYEGAMLVYNEQDNQTKDALDRMVDLLSGIARRRMWVSAGGENRMVMTLPDQVIRQNMTYMAVEILKDLATFDVRVDNFTFPDHLCGVCNRPRKKVKKRV
jgi:hypothetical protein